VSLLLNIAHYCADEINEFNIPSCSCALWRLMFNLLAANLHDSNAHDLTSSLGLIGNSILMSTQQGVTSSSRGREFLSSPGKKFLVSRKKFSTFNIPTRECHELGLVWATGQAACYQYICGPNTYTECIQIFLNQLKLTMQTFFEFYRKLNNMPEP